MIKNSQDFQKILVTGFLLKKKRNERMSQEMLRD